MRRSACRPRESPDLAAMAPLGEPVRTSCNGQPVSLGRIDGGMGTAPARRSMAHAAVQTLAWLNPILSASPDAQVRDRPHRTVPHCSRRAHPTRSGSATRCSASSSAPLTTASEDRPSAAGISMAATATPAAPAHTAGVSPATNDAADA